MKTEAKENLIDSLQNAGMLYFVLGSLISSDSLIDANACREALHILETLKAEFAFSSIKDNSKIQSLLEKAENIITRDLANFSVDKSNENIEK